MSNLVGCCKVEVCDKQNDITFPMLVLYPTNIASTPIAFGPFSLEVSMEAPVADRHFSVVMISHGSGGSNLTHRTLGMYLVQSGFVVCMPEHPFNNRHNNELQYTIANMTHRPRHIRLALDEVFSNDKFKNHLHAESAAIIGHSVGGYTALALAGAVPHTQALFEFCQSPASADEPYWYGLMRKNGITPQQIEVKADRRIKAVVLFAPDVSLFMSKGALRNVHVPILMLLAEKDDMPLETAAVVIGGLPECSQLSYSIVENAGHYSFLSPFPESIKSRVGDAARDPEGFDRDEFHQRLNLEVLTFLQKALG